MSIRTLVSCLCIYADYHLDEGGTLESLRDQLRIKTWRHLLEKGLTRRFRHANRAPTTERVWTLRERFPRRIIQQNYVRVSFDFRSVGGEVFEEYHQVGLEMPPLSLSTECWVNLAPARFHRQLRSAKSITNHSIDLATLEFEHLCRRLTRVRDLVQTINVASVDAERVAYWHSPIGEFYDQHPRIRQFLVKYNL